MKSKERLIVVQMIILGLVTLALSSNGSPDLEGQSLEKLQENTKQWVNEIQLSGTFRLGGKDYASLVTPEGNFWVEEGKFSPVINSSNWMFPNPNPPPSSKKETSKHGSDFAWECLFPKSARCYTKI